MRQQFLFLICAVQFLTRLPIPALKGFEPDWISRCARYFPLVGQLVGAICAAVYWAASLVWSGWPPALLAIGAGVVVTGALHEDGLAKAADGLGGGGYPQQRLTLMRDSPIGTYGALALGLALALKAAALADLKPTLGALALLAGHGAARGAAVLAMRALPYVGHLEVSRWKPTPANLSWGETATALALSAWPFLFLSPDVAAMGVAVGGALALALTLTARRLLGGYTGDVLGAVEQTFEIGFFLGVAALAGG